MHTNACLCLVSWTRPLPSPALDVLQSPARVREDLATVAWFPWHIGMSIIVLSHDHLTAQNLFNFIITRELTIPQSFS